VRCDDENESEVENKTKTRPFGLSSVESSLGGLGLVAQPTPRKPLPNPGQYDMMRMKTASIMRLYEHFDGFMFRLSKQITPQFMVSHDFMLGPHMIPKQAGGGMYAFNAQVAFDKGRTMMTARADTQKQVQGRFIRQLNRNTLAKMTAVVVPLPPDRGTGYMGVFNAGVEYGKGDYSASFELGNQMGNYHAKLGYLQSLTHDIALGMSTEYRQGATAHPVTSKIGIRAKRGLKDMWSAEMTSNSTFSMDYVRDISKRLSMATQINYDFKHNKSSSGFGYKYALKQSEIKGTIHTDGKFQCLVKEKINPFASITLCAEVDFWRSINRFGWGMTFGG